VLLQAAWGTYEALWSLSGWSMCSFTSARIRCTGGAEKVGPSAEKYFFDSIDHLRTSTVHRSIRDKLAFTGGRGPIPGYRGDEFARAQNVTLAVAISQLTCVRRARPPCPREVVTRIGPVTVRQPRVRVRAACWHASRYASTVQDSLDGFGSNALVVPVR